MQRMLLSGEDMINIYQWFATSCPSSVKYETEISISDTKADTVYMKGKVCLLSSFRKL